MRHLEPFLVRYRQRIVSNGTGQGTGVTKQLPPETTDETFEEPSNSHAPPGTRMTLVERETTDDR